MIPDFAQSLYDRFQREGIPLLLAGGWAVCHHGYSRYTSDIDWICSRANEASAKEVMASLDFDIAFEAMATRFQHKKHPDLAPVDLPVIDFEALLAMKLHALKDDKEREGKDILDIRFLLAENPRAITEDHLRVLCERYAGPGAYNHVRMIS
jgi:hypothetical protein